MTERWQIFPILSWYQRTLIFEPLPNATSQHGKLQFLCSSYEFRKAGLTSKLILSERGLSSKVCEASTCKFTTEADCPIKGGNIIMLIVPPKSSYVYGKTDVMLS